ncbi:MAG: rhomboid family intramembrane serine protease [Saprospiraceae bacterium]|nr:rhomboid family intramembrane serine protease [Saprospiraceae bacterium]
MQQRPILEQIKSFYKRYTLLSILMIVNLVVSLFIGTKFFIILYNVYMTYFAGKFIIDFINNRKLLTTYIYGALAGMFVYMIFFVPVYEFEYKIFFSVGVTSAVMALLVAIGTYKPNLELMLMILGKVKLKWVVIVLVVLDFISVNTDFHGAEISHLGGVLVGFLSIYLLKQTSANNWFTKWFYSSKPKLRKVKPDKKGRPLTDEEYNTNRVIDQDEIDKILEKISKSGYESLSKSDKEKLFRMSGKK